MLKMGICLGPGVLQHSNAGRTGLSVRAVYIKKQFKMSFCSECKRKTKKRTNKNKIHKRTKVCNMEGHLN